MLNHLLEYVKSMRSYIDPVCFVVHDNLDETPLRLRVPFSDGDAPGGVSQLAKVYVTEKHWTMVLRTSHIDHTGSSASSSLSSGSEQNQSDPTRFLLIYGAWSPSVVAADRGTATAIAAVMQRAPQPPAVIEELFPYRLRLAERDEAGANIKAERLHGNTLNGWSSMTWHCTAHKVHSIAEKVLSLDKNTVSGVINTLLSMQTTQHLEQLQEALVRVAQSSLRVVPWRDLAPDVALHRKNVLTQFAPDKKTPRKRATVALLCSLFNGDWRKDNVAEHLCCGEGCCSTLEETSHKIGVAIRALLRTCKPSKLCKDNWLQWRRPIGLVGLLCYIHKLLPRAFSVAFPKRRQPEPPHQEVKKG